MSEHEEYTPSMDRVRHLYARIIRPDGTVELASRRQKEFDRWLAAHDRELRERIAREIEVMLIGSDAGRGSEVIAAHNSAVWRAAAQIRKDTQS